MRPPDDDQITGVVRADRTERDYRGDEGTVRIEPGSPWAPPPPPEFAGPALPRSVPVALPEAPRPSAPTALPLPGWVLPYMIGGITLVLVGLHVLWIQARILGHF